MSREKKSEIEGTYKTTLTYKCPTRGMVTQEVTVTRYKKQEATVEKPVDSDVAELLKAVSGEDLDELGFHEDN